MHVLLKRRRFQAAEPIREGIEPPMLSLKDGGIRARFAAAKEIAVGSPGHLGSLRWKID